MQSSVVNRTLPNSSSIAVVVSSFLQSSFIAEFSCFCLLCFEDSHCLESVWKPIRVSWDADSQCEPEWVVRMIKGTPSEKSTSSTWFLQKRFKSSERRLAAVSDVSNSLYLSNMSKSKNPWNFCFSWKLSYRIWILDKVSASTDYPLECHESVALQ